ncbi:putative tyrosine-protein kinase ephrin type A/B receptor [Plasmopara halstedii]
MLVEDKRIMIWIIQYVFFLLSFFIFWCKCDEIVDLLSPFSDLKNLVEQVAKDAAKVDTVKVADRKYPLASIEMGALEQIYRDCGTQESIALRTWCIDTDEKWHFRESSENKRLCPRGVTTHPCTGRILHRKRSLIEEEVEYLRPWEGIRCDALTEPTTLTHIYLPRQSLRCELAKLDLSVMISLEQLDLSDNELFGGFPDWLGDMTMLRLLNLRGNHFSGHISSSLAGNDALELINLSNNKLTASTLRYFDAFHRLQHFNISYNGFHGDLSMLPAFKFLESFDVSNNFLTGNIPPQLSLWGREDPHDPDENSSLAIVDVSNNMFTGNLPEISNQSVLQRLQKFARPDEFDGNMFMCPVPAELIQSKLYCVCGDGFTVKSTVQPSVFKSADATGASEHLVLASEFANRCVRCSKGFYSNYSTRQQCRPCPPGSVPDLNSGKRAASCTFCPSGSFAIEKASHSCTPCPPGTFVNGTGATSCDLCNPGEFATHPGSSSCTACAVGSYANVTGMSACTLCPPGTYVNVEGEAACRMCPIGTYNSGRSVGCSLCPIGSSAPQLGHVRCSSCSPGKFYDINTKACTFCRPGTYTNKSGQTECKLCESGTVAEKFGSDTCAPIAAPGSGYDTSTTLVKCKPGTFNDGKLRTCQPCPIGTFAANRSSRTCLLCARGSYAANVGSAHCKLAPQGSFVRFEGANRTELCDPNTVTAKEGSTFCIQCATPSFSFLPGGVKCGLARPGEVYDHVKWPRLALSLAGVELRDHVNASSDQESRLEALIHIWTEMLVSYSGLSCVLHVLQVVSRPNHSTQIFVAVEPTIGSANESQFDQRMKNYVGDTIQHVVEAAKKTTETFLSKPDLSQIDNRDKENDVNQLRHLVRSKLFQEALVRQINRANLIKWPLSYGMVNLSMVEPPFSSTRALKCPFGTYFSTTKDLNKNERKCLPCPIGSYSRVSGALQCELCPQGSFSSEKGQNSCHSCPLGADATPGSSFCVNCSWFTYECEGFWQDLIATMCGGLVFLRLLYQKLRILCMGDQAVQQQDESAALMTAVRTHGRTIDDVRYAPMVRALSMSDITSSYIGVWDRV